jgi:hypothetical protein
MAHQLGCVPVGLPLLVPGGLRVDGDDGGFAVVGGEGGRGEER